MNTYEVIGSENVKYRVVVQASSQGEAEKKFFSHLRAQHDNYIDTFTSGISIEVKELVEEA